MREMQRGRGLLALFLAGVLSGACSAPLKTSVAPLRMPATYSSFVQWEGLELAIDPIDTPEKSQLIFGTDMWEATVLPLHLIARNVGTHEFEIASGQIFGVAPSGELANAYTLQQATDRVRASSIGTTAATGLVVGALAGAAAGAAIGGTVAGGRGVGTGAAIGGTAGGMAGTAEGASDTITHRFRRELAAQDFSDRVVRPGHIEHGFLYMQWAQYRGVRLLLFDITTNKRQEISLPITVSRPAKASR
jgi:outer membrane lipoprotein SlyB